MSDLNQNKSFNYSSFSEFCFHKDELPAETKHTVEVLLRVAGTDDYLEAERVLLNEPGLYLDDYNLTDLSPLASLNNLTYLNISENEIYDLSPFQGLKNLIDLDLSDNQIKDISSLETLINITRIYLDFNQIIDISILKSLKNIQELYLHSNYIKDIASLKNLVKLEYLTLDDNQIIDISSLKNLINLTSLSVSHNQIYNLNSIKPLHKLCYLDVSFNKITDFGLFQEFKDINHLHIQGNPIYGLVSPTDLIDKYQKLLSVPLNHQKVIEAVKLVYTSIGLKIPKVMITNNYQSFYTEAINLLKSNQNTNNQDRESYINQKIDEKAKIRNTLYNRSLDFLDEEYSPIRKTVIRELIQEKFNNSEFIQQIHSISQTIQFHLASKLLCESSLGEYSQACICLNNITPEHILHEIYLIETYQSLLKIPLDEKTQQWYDCLNQLFEHCGWFIPFEDVCIVCDRPSKFSLDSETRLHSEGEPAIQFADGYGLYYHHGVALPEQYGTVHPNQWEAKWLLSENNSELRRILIQAIGYNRICDELKAINLDSFREYSLIKIDADADVEPIVLLKMICPSTGYTHVLRVPPSMESAKEAITWVNWGIDPNDFAVES